jgi:hypothetical protein
LIGGEDYQTGRNRQTIGQPSAKAKTRYQSRFPIRKMERVLEEISNSSE